MIWMMLFLWNPGEEAVPLISLNKSWNWNLSEHEIYRSRMFAVSDDGTVVVLDRDKNRAVRISPDGKTASQLGTNGEGPGELSAPGEITWSRKEQVFVILDAGRRASKWDNNGVFVAEYRFNGNGRSPRMVGNKKMILARAQFGMNGGTPGLVQVRLGKDKAKEILNYVPDKPTTFTNAGNEANPLRIAFRWDPRLMFSTGSDFIAYAFGGEPTLHIIDFKGKQLVGPIAVRIQRFEVSDDQLEEGTLLMPNDWHAGIRKGLVRPEAWPYFREIHVDEKDRIWMVGSSRNVKSSHPYLLYSRTGKKLGRGYVRKSPLVISGDAMYYFDDEGEDLHLEKATLQFK